MSGVVCNASRKIAAENILFKTAAQALTLRLYKNVKTPANGDNINASEYIEATFLGYAPIALNAVNWSVTTAFPTMATYPLQTFTSSANQTAELVYGYYITRADGTLYLAELFSDGPYSVSTIAQTVKVTPTQPVS
jgi:hypothetical protein